MKRFLTILIFSSLSLTACHFLEVDHVGKSDIDGFYTDPNSVRAAVYGAHNLCYGFYDKYFIPYSEVAADELILSSTEATWLMYQDFSVTADDEAGPLGYMWRDGYQIINNCNQILEHIPSMLKQFPKNEDELDTYMAQALFLRALVHFDMCLCYGQNYSYTPDASHLGIPVVQRTLSLNEQPRRNTVKELYDAVLSDLVKALPLFHDEIVTNNYLPTSLACKALLARVYLYMSDYDNAVKYSGEVISAKQLVDRKDYFDMFYLTESKNDESLYRLNGFKQGKSMYNLFWKDEPKARPSKRVLDLFGDEEDIRTKLLFSPEYGNVCLKYDCPSSADVTLIYKNHIVLRVSEMYLIRAEANLRLDRKEAVASDINSLRARAYGHDKPVSWKTSEDLESLVAEERMRELYAEGHRLWDITRLHKNLQRTSDSSANILELSYPDYRFVLPIPSVELEANKNMIPNPSSNE